MSNVAQSDCRCRYRKLLRWFVYSCALVLTIVSLFYFFNSLREQLSAQRAQTVAAVVVIGLLLSLGMSIMGTVASKRSIREQLAVQLVLLAVVSGTLTVTYDWLRSGQSLASYYGGGGAGVVSGYEAILVFAICLLSFIVQMVLIHYESLDREAHLIVGGSLAIVGILLPKLLESYEVLQAYCAAAECDDEYRFTIVWYEIAIAFSASLAALFVAGVLATVWRSSLYRLFEADPLCDSCSLNPANGLSERALLDLDDWHGATEGQDVPMLHGEGVEGGASSRTASAQPHGGVSGHLAAAAVAGLVAGACFSVVNRLFNRR